MSGTFTEIYKEFIKSTSSYIKENFRYIEQPLIIKVKREYLTDFYVTDKYYITGNTILWGCGDDSKYVEYKYESISLEKICLIADEIKKLKEEKELPNNENNEDLKNF